MKRKKYTKKNFLTRPKYNQKIDIKNERELISKTAFVNSIVFLSF